MEKSSLELKEELDLAYQNHKKNKLDVAENIYRKILKTDPKQFDANFLLGTLLAQIKRYEESIEYLKKAIKTKPNFAIAYYNLGISLQEVEKHDEAVVAYKKAIEIKPDYVEAYNNCGKLYKELDEYEMAKVFFKKAIKIKNNFANANHNLAVIYKELGDLDKAKIFFKNATKYNPDNLAAYYQLKNLDDNFLDSDNRKTIINVINSSICSEKNLAFGNLLLANYEEKKNNYEKEFNFLIKGHEHFFKSKVSNFNVEINYWLNELPKTIDKIKLAKSASEDKNIKPIYIVGTPRSGSTLIEKVIASGESSIPIGEETGILARYLRKNFKINNFDLNLEKIKTHLIEKYKEKKLIQEKYNKTFTDKSLENFFYVNIIEKIFKRAKIVNCLRNPLSSIVSIFKNNLVELSWAHNLDNIFKYFDNYYKIINKFKREHPNMIYDLEYEKFIIDPVSESKKLMKFCELPWDKRCLNFHSRKDLISKTASSTQIRKGIFKNSSKRDLPYIKFLEKYKSKYTWFNQ